MGYDGAQDSLHRDSTCLLSTCSINIKHPKRNDIAAGWQELNPESTEIKLKGLRKHQSLSRD